MGDTIRWVLPLIVTNFNSPLLYVRHLIVENTYDFLVIVLRFAEQHVL